MSAIGIDLGTTNSCVAVYRKDQVEIVPNDQGHRVTPSYVSFTEDERLVGDYAKNEVSSNFENTLFQIKRLIGRTYDDPMLQADMKLWGFTLVNDDNKPKISVVYKDQTKTFAPEEISAMILEYLKNAAEIRLGGQTVKDAVITVPAYFNDAQRNATIDAGKIAGLNVLRVINEPTAAAIAYGLDRETNKEQNVLVFDLGGGTFDVTIVNIEGKEFCVEATNGDTHLGGDDFDNRMIEHFVTVFNSKNDCDMSQDKRGLSRLRVACEVAKKHLSVSERAKVQLDGLHKGKDFIETITRAKFEELNYEYFQKTRQIVKDTLSNARMDKNEIDKVVLVGGSTRIPKVRELLQDFFGETVISKSIDPDEAVAYGAAALAAELYSSDTCKILELTVEDVVPLSLGWKSSRGDMVTIVQRNTKIPTEKGGSCMTPRDDVTEMTFNIFEGERDVADENHRLGGFKIKDIPRSFRGDQKFEILFTIDINGILNVMVRNSKTRKESKIKIERKGKLSKKEIRKMIKDAEKYKEEDAEWKKRSEKACKLEAFVYAVKHAITDEISLELSYTDKNKITEKCDEIISWLNDNRNPPVSDTRKKKADLEKTCQPVFKRIPRGTEILSKYYK